MTSNVLLKYRMIGVALAAVAANVGFCLMTDAQFSVQKALLLAGLCVVTTFLVHHAVTAVEAAVIRKDRK